MLLLALVGFSGISGLDGIWAVVLMLMVFASVVLHELGHAIVARQRGIHVSGIELGFFGGMAKMTQVPSSARDELAIAAAGPAVSLALGGLGLGLATLLAPSEAAAWLAWLGWTNLVICGFNMLPALPMDGGRILRALLSRWYSYVEATDLAVKVARGFAVVFALVGIWAAPRLLLLAPLLWLMGSRERVLARRLAPRMVSTRTGYRMKLYDEPELVAPTVFGDTMANAPFGMDLSAVFGAMMNGSVHGRGTAKRFAVRREGGKVIVVFDE